MAGIEQLAGGAPNPFSSLGGASGLLGGTGMFGAAQNAREQQELRKFQSLMDGVQAGISEKAETAEAGRLPGEYRSGFAAQDIPSEKHAPLSGAALTGAGVHGTSAAKTVDKTSDLYQKALELESYFVKIMLSSMRNTVVKSPLNGGENQYAQKMYEDMLFDELSVVMTKNAGFGLADQIYLQYADLEA